LIFDYGAQWVRRPADVLGDAVLVVGLAAASGWLLFRVGRRGGLGEGEGGAGALHRPAERDYGGQAAGFAGACFFLILAPTGFVPLIRQTIAEHRMYLALAAVVAVAVGALYRVAGRTTGSILGLAAAAACLGLTVQRNEDYRTRIALYRDTAAKRPDNVLAHYNLGMALAEAGHPGEAASEFETALRLEPQFPQADYNLGKALAAAGRRAEAATAFTAALRINPNYAEAHRALGAVLLRLGRSREARWHFNAAVLLNPDDAEARAQRDKLDAQK
jgi:tetratricopeptide (TPR) repeat protein